MPTVIVNDQSYEVQIGEVILDVARREAMHIGFACDGNGLCQMCECRVLKGAEHLNPLNEAEKAWLTEAQQAQGLRLACQTSVRGTGPIEILTRAEELRRLAWGVLLTPLGESHQANLIKLITAATESNLAHVSKFPANMLYSFANVASVSFTVGGFQKILDDAQRITQRMLQNSASPAAKPSPSSEITKPLLPVAPAAPVKQPKPVAEGSSAAAPTLPVEQPKPVVGVKPAAPAAPVEQPKPVVEVKPVAPAAPVEQPKPVAEVKPAAPVEPPKPVIKPLPSQLRAATTTPEKQSPPSREPSGPRKPPSGK
jgi:ferredoxin